MDQVPTWALLVCLGALGALVMFFMAILRTHMEKDDDTRSDVRVTESNIADIKDRELPKLEAKLEDHEHRLHAHGREIQSLIAKDYLKDRNK